MKISIHDIVEKNKKYRNCIIASCLIFMILVVTLHALIVPIGTSVVKVSQKESKATVLADNQIENETVEKDLGYIPVFAGDIDLTALDGKSYAIMSITGKRVMTAEEKITDGNNVGLVGVSNAYVMGGAVSVGHEFTFVAVDAANAKYKIKKDNMYLKTIDNTTGTSNPEILVLTDDENEAEIFTISASTETTNTPLFIETEKGNYINTSGGENTFNEFFSIWKNKVYGNKSCLGVPVKKVYTPLKNTVSPYSSVINLFDYKANDNPDKWNENDGAVGLGINRGHYLQFRSAFKTNDGIVTANHYTGKNNGALQNIVAPQLGSDGYPTLSGDATIVQGNSESLKYLFDKSENENKRVYSKVKNLLTVDKEGYYCYDSTKNYAYYNEETNSFIVYDDWAIQFNGGNQGEFFPFNSLSDVDKGTRAEENYLNHYFGLSLTNRFVHRYNGYTDSSHSKDTRFEFSGDDDVWIFIDGVLVADLGGIKDRTGLSIDFVTGTVTIDNVVGHTGAYTRTFADIFADTEVELVNNDGNITFANNTYHTLKFYYLERGGNASNLKLKYNLAEIPPTNIHKVNQYGDNIANAEFAVYAADTNWNYLTNKGGTIVTDNLINKEYTYDNNKNITVNGQTAQALYTGVTDADGNMNFINEDEMPLALDEMERDFGKYFIIRETKVPEGHRPLTQDVHLYIKDGILQATDQYQSGVLTSPTAMVDAPSDLCVAADSYPAIQNLINSGDIVLENGKYVVKDYYDIEHFEQDAKGTLFAVVLKRNGKDNNVTDMLNLNFDTWDPVYGSVYDGYEVAKFDGEDAVYGSQIEAVIATAKEQAKIENVVFKKESSGMQLTIHNFPGKFERYYTYMLDNEISSTNKEPQYLIAYYWTSASSLEEATPGNTVRITSHANVVNENVFDVSWASTIEITNMENRLFFQKRKGAEEGGELINGAVFALYEVETEYDGAGNEYVYYRASDEAKTKIYLEVGTDGKFTGRAGLTHDNMNGTYTINDIATNIVDGIVQNTGAGEIYVTIGGNTYTIKPAIDPINGNRYVGVTHGADNCTYVKEDGTGHFTLVNQGKFVMREIKAPKGYRINDVEIKVMANNTGVFANAGIEGDGLSVGNGAGYLVRKFNQFASEGSIDETLTWVYSALAVKDNNTFAAAGDEITDLTTWQYAKKVAGDADGYASGRTNDISQAMVTYLNYANGGDGVIFDYAINENQNARAATTNGAITYPATLAGEGKLRLNTTTGWSTAEIYQDYAYGIVESGLNTETYYEDIRDAGNLAELFSGSTFVQVVDDYVVDVNVIKTDASKGEEILDGAKFKLYKLDKTTEPAKKLYYVLDGDTVSWAENDVDNAYEFTTLAEEGTKSYFRIQDLEGGEYYLEETVSPEGYILLEDPIKFVIGYVRNEENEITGYGVNIDEEYDPQDITNVTDDPYYNEDSEALQYKFTVPNEKIGIDVEVSKFGHNYEDDENLVELSGAEFMLYYTTVEDEEEIKHYYKETDNIHGTTWTEDINEARVFSADDEGNSFIISNLQTGTYYLDETVIPNGYARPGPITQITVDLDSEDNVVTVVNSGGVDDEAVTTRTVEGKTIYNVKIVNLTSYELPKAGGSGIYGICNAGFSLILLGGLIFIGTRFKRKK